jgi:hypothetical protein
MEYPQPTKKEIKYLLSKRDEIIQCIEDTIKVHQLKVDELRECVEIIRIIDNDTNLVITTF